MARLRHEMREALRVIIRVAAVILHCPGNNLKIPGLERAHHLNASRLRPP